MIVTIGLHGASCTQRAAYSELSKSLRRTSFWSWTGNDDTAKERSRKTGVHWVHLSVNAPITINGPSAEDADLRRNSSRARLRDCSAGSTYTRRQIRTDGSCVTKQKKTAGTADPERPNLFAILPRTEQGLREILYVTGAVTANANDEVPRTRATHCSRRWRRLKARQFR
jgi:hypothetical protein